MLAQTGCDGVVVGRGCLGRPWLFRDLADAFAGRPLQGPPLLGTVVTVMKEHVRLLVAHRESERYGTRDFRKHVGWYLTGYPVGGVKRRQLSEVSSIAQVDALLDELDPATELPAEALRMPRGHTYGPKPVSLPEGWLLSADDPGVPEGADVWTSGG
jgi:tRNA-dihydrouridine synthase